MPETKLPCKPAEYMQVKFNPGDHNKFCILSQSVLYSFSIHQAYDVTERGDQKILGESYRTNITEWRHDNQDMMFCKFIWDPFSRVHIVTDQSCILMVHPKKGVLEHTHHLDGGVHAILLTQKHLIVSQDDGLLQWFKLDLPVILSSDKDNDTKHLTVENVVEMEWNLNRTIGETGDYEVVSHMHYSRDFRQLIIGTSTGMFGRLEIEAEAVNFEEDEEEAQQKQEKRVMENEFVELGRFHTEKITGIKELGETTQLVTISTDHYMTLWESTTQSPIASVYQPSYPTSLDVSSDGCAVFLGTHLGAFRIYDVSNRR